VARGGHDRPLGEVRAGDGLDPDRVVEDVRAVATAVRERAESAWGALPDAQAQRMRDVVLDLTEKTATTS